MKNRILMLMAIFMIFWSCNDENVELQSQDSTDSTTAKETNDGLSEEDFVCSTYLENPSDDISGRVSYKGTYWNRGETIRIKFLNGSSYMQGLVKSYANEWTRYANLKFQWVGRYENADIKIIFDNNGSGGASRVGTQCRYFDQNTATMWYHKLDRYSNTNKRRVVLHEFGHALGLGHEHQNPTASISWNKPAVYNYYYKAGWTKQMIDDNIFAKFSKTTHDYGYFDPKSIMMYDIPSYFTTNRVSYPRNYVLSMVDMHSIGMIYPYSKPGNSRVQLFMYWSPGIGDHFYTNNWGELGWAKYSYRYDRTMGYLDANPSAENVPLHRYYAYGTGDHFYSTNMIELGDARHGYIYEGVLGYIKKYKVPNSLPLYRYWNGILGDHFYTTNWNELGWGKYDWNYEGVVGYIMQK